MGIGVYWLVIVRQKANQPEIIRQCLIERVTV